MYIGGAMPGRRAGSGTMPRAQKRAAKGSTLLQRQSTLPILLYYLSMGLTYSHTVLLIAGGHKNVCMVLIKNIFIIIHLINIDDKSAR